MYKTQIEPLLQDTYFPGFKDIYLLENEAIIITYIYKYLNTSETINIELLIKLLHYIHSISQHFENKLQMPKVHTTNKKSINRSSYKFCNFKDECKYNYTPGHNGCYAHHYVHNMVTADIVSLLAFIETGGKRNNEIIKCCNTLSYVIKHMYDELYNVIYYSTNVKNVNVFHKNNYSSKNGLKQTH